MEIITLASRKARKVHDCDCCGLNINKGESYIACTYKDSNIYTWKSHVRCDNLAKKLFYDEDVYTSNDFQSLSYSLYFDLGGNESTPNMETILDYLSNHYNI